MVNFEVAIGQIGTVSYGPTRTEEDYVNHLMRTLEADPLVIKWHIIADNLNIHQSESLVRYVAAESDLDEAQLGVKGQSGILESMKSRAEFLSNPDHQDCFSLYAQECLLEEPGRDLVQYFCAKSDQAGEF